MRLMDMARRYEARGGATSFRGFVDELEARAEREEAAEAPIAEEGTEGVRIMTVHSAKGLEFPVIILADVYSAGALPAREDALLKELSRTARRAEDAKALWQGVQFVAPFPCPMPSFGSCRKDVAAGAAGVHNRALLE